VRRVLEDSPRSMLYLGERRYSRCSNSLWCALRIVICRSRASLSSRFIVFEASARASASIASPSRCIPRFSFSRSVTSSPSQRGPAGAMRRVSPTCSPDCLPSLFVADPEMSGDAVQTTHCAAQVQDCLSAVSSLIASQNRSARLSARPLWHICYRGTDAARFRVASSLPRALPAT